MATKKRVNGRKKGHAAERKLAKLFSAWWGSSFTRTPMSGGFATAKFREDWNAAGDLVTPDKTFPFCVESKKVEGWTLEQLLTSDKSLIHEWWKQTVRETPANKFPLLVFTKNHAPLYGMMYSEDLPPIATNWRSFQTSLFGCRVTIFSLENLFLSSKEHWHG